MRNTIKAAIAAGPAGILALGGGVLYAQHELHYLLRPSVVETIAGIAAVGGGIVWSRGHGKRKAAAEQAIVDRIRAERQEAEALDARDRLTALRDQALPQGQSAYRDSGTVTYGNVVDHIPGTRYPA